MKLPCEKYTPLLLGKLTLTHIIQVLLCLTHIPLYTPC